MCTEESHFYSMGHICADTSWYLCAYFCWCCFSTIIYCQEQKQQQLLWPLTPYTIVLRWTSGESWKKQRCWWLVSWGSYLTPSDQAYSYYMGILIIATTHWLWWRVSNSWTWSLLGRTCDPIKQNETGFRNVESHCGPDQGWLVTHSIW